MKTYIIILGCINLILMPVILLWQILYSFFNYAQIIKREPGSLGIRKWSLYGRYYLRSGPGYDISPLIIKISILRHFNELEHELLARLSRAYRPAAYYMDIFVSPMATVIAKTVAFISGSVLAVLVLLTVWDEDVLNVEHVSREISNKIFEDILPLLGVWVCQWSFLCHFFKENSMKLLKCFSLG